ncbi:hypothetical protein MMC17_005732 [Xylographa soralifera]|nr:hypothetical protein [Xylographa soralifera]
MFSREHPHVDELRKLPNQPQVKQYLPLKVLACDCGVCRQQYRTKSEQGNSLFAYKKFLSNSEASQISSDYVRSIEKDREHITRLCASHGNTILGRWKKKSRDKRQDILLKADSTMYQYQWSQPRLSLQCKQLEELRRYRNAWLLPYINVEALRTDPARLLSIVHNRIKYSPAEWAPFDSRQLSVAWQSGALAVEHCSSCLVMYGPKYGDIVNWEKEAAHRWDVVGFPRARLILEAQARLLGLLRNVVEQLLEGLDTNNPGASEKWIELTMLGFKQTNKIEFWSSYTNQPFSAAPIFDIEDLLFTVETRLQAAQDHVWLLQTEPSYLRYFIKSFRQATLFEDINRNFVYDNIAVELVHQTWNISRWQWVLIECQNIKQQYLKFRDRIYPGTRLPPEYDQALTTLEMLLVNQMHIRAKHLFAVMPQRPGFRHSWRFDYSKPGKSTRWRATEGPTEEDFNTDPLDWCLGQLLGDPDAARRYDHALLFAFLDDYLSTCSSAERARLDQHLYDLYSDYAANHALLVTIRLNRPRSSIYTLGNIRESNHAWRYAEVNIDLWMKNATQAAIAKLLVQFNNLRLPGSKVDNIFLERHENIREASRRIWTKVRGFHRSKLEDLKCGSEDIQSDLDMLSADTDPQYLTAIASEREDILARMVSATTTPSRTALQTQWGSATEPKVSVTESKSKAKSRPIATMAEITGTADVKAEDLQIVQLTVISPMILVKKRTYDILTEMYSANCEETAKTVDWDSFELAMADVGFSARNNGGSAVSFEKNDGLDARQNGRIVFHKPHPVAKIDPVMLYCMGRRMGKWFGWSRGSFAVA